MSSKRKSKKDETIDFLAEQLNNNVVAIKETGKRKTLSIHDLKTIRPLTEPQRQMIESYFMGNNIVANGMAGTGKTLISLYLALQDILDPKSPRTKIIIVRAAANSVSLGFTPGTLEEKMEVYESPYKSLVAELVKSVSYDDMKKSGRLEFKIASYARGESWDNAVVICDEFQSFQEIDVDTVMTRIGKNSRVLICGDTYQNELKHKKHMESGYEYFLEISKKMTSFDEICFRVEDVVRSGFVREYLMAKFS